MEPVDVVGGRDHARTCDGAAFVGNHLADEDRLGHEHHVVVKLAEQTERRLHCPVAVSLDPDPRIAFRKAQAVLAARTDSAPPRSALKSRA